jgi:hypothetical protein
MRATVESDLVAKRALQAKAIVRALEDDATVDESAKFIRAADMIDTTDARVLAMIDGRGARSLADLAKHWPGAANILDSAVASLGGAGLIFDRTASMRPPGPGNFEARYDLTTFGRAFLEDLEAEGLEEELGKELPP